jgi:hypothetical protein
LHSTGQAQIYPIESTLGWFAKRNSTGRAQTFCSADLAEQKMHSLREKIFQMDLNDITYKINGAVFEVNKILGSGFLEKVYPVK